MSFEFLFPLIGAGATAVFSLIKTAPKSETTKLTFIEDEVPITEIKDDGLVLTETGQKFKVIALIGESIAGKKLDELEKAFVARSLFFRNISENKVHLRIVSQKTITPIVRKNPIGNPFLDGLVKRWESKLEQSFKTKHYLVVSGYSEAEIEAVIKEVFSLLSDLEPSVLSINGADGKSPLLSFLSSFYNAEELNISDAETNLHKIEQSRIKIDKSGQITQTLGGQNKHRFVFGIKDFGEALNGQIFDHLLALPYPITISVHIEPLAKSKAITSLDRHKTQMNLGKKEFNLSTNSEIKDLRDLIDGNKQSLLQAEFSIFVTVEDPCQIKEVANSIYGVLGNYGIRSVLEERLAMPKFWGQCPGRDYFNRELLLTSANLADCCPLTKAETGLNKCDWGNQPVCYFPTAPSGNPFGWTFHATAEDQAPPHCAVFAPTGSGKSVLILHLISQAMAAYPDLSVYALDRDSGLNVYTEMVGGSYHQIAHDGDICLNPFDCDKSEETNLNLFLQILTSAETEEEKKDIRIFISEILKQPRGNRTMKAFSAELARSGKFKEKLERWVKGDTLSAKLFNGKKDTMDITKNRLNVFGVDGLKEDLEASAAFFFYIFNKIEQNAKSGKPSLLIVDEAPTLLASPALKSEIQKLLKTARKQRIAVFMAFQGTADLNALGLKETILTNCHTRFFYSGAASTAEEVDGFFLTESETDFVLTKGKKVKGASRPILMQRAGSNVFLDTDMSCLGEYLNAYKGGSKTIKLMKSAKNFAPNDWVNYYLKHFGQDEQ